jgi:hypothetical protein
LIARLVHYSYRHRGPRGIDNRMAFSSASRAQICICESHRPCQLHTGLEGLPKGRLLTAVLTEIRFLDIEFHIVARGQLFLCLNGHGVRAFSSCIAVGPGTPRRLYQLFVDIA